MTRWMHTAFAGALLTFLVALPATITPALAQNRALVIGIGTYADPKLAPSRPGPAAADIAAIETLLTGTLGFAQNEIKILRDGQATKAAILDGITDWLRPDRQEIEAARREEEERKAKQTEGVKKGKKRKKVKKRRRKKKAKAKPRRSFLYFAGHGYFQRDLNAEEADGLDEALVPFDAAVTGSGADSPVTGMISDDEFSTALKTLEGRRVTVVLDTGHSGQVTRSAVRRARPVTDTRTPAIHGAIRSIAGDPIILKQKDEGDFVETSFATGTLAVWSAVSASQTAVLDMDATPPRGLFTRLFVDGHQAGAADRNDNGVLSNTELLEYLKKGSRDYCAKHASRCEMGLTPRLYPDRAHAGVALRKAGKRKRNRNRHRKLTIGMLTDFLVSGNSHQTVIEQIPPSPVSVGAGDIRIRVTSRQDGSLILLSLTDAGRLMQLYPNQFGDAGKEGQPGRISAKAALTVPESNHGLRLTATDPGKGHIVAILTRDPVDFGENVTARSIGDIPRSEALGFYLPKLAAALASPLHTGKAGTNTGSAIWSVAIHRYEILP